MGSSWRPEQNSLQDTWLECLISPLQLDATKRTEAVSSRVCPPLKPRSCFVLDTIVAVLGGVCYDTVCAGSQSRRRDPFRTQKSDVEFLLCERCNYHAVQSAKQCSLMSCTSLYFYSVSCHVVQCHVMSGDVW